MITKVRTSIILGVILACQNLVLACDVNDVDGIIENINKTVSNIKSLSAKIEYIHIQPLFDTKTVKSGQCFYVKEPNQGRLRINFISLKQDDAEQQQYKEDYIFDGFTLTRIDYQTKSAVSEQLSNDKSIDPFELIQNYFPIIGFAKPAELTQQFRISTLKTPEDANSFITLRLIPKKDTKFFTIYKQVDVKIKSDSLMPFDFTAITKEGEKIIILLSQMDSTTEIDKTVFKVDIPEGFAYTENKKP